MCVGLVGGESTGKSTLAADLADALGAVVVPEALRDFVDRAGRTPRCDEQRALLREQVDGISRAIATAALHGCDLVVSDPAPLMTAVYSVMYFADDTLTSDARAHADETFDLLLWCRPDLQWVADGPQRDGPEGRTRADELLAQVLPALRVPHIEVTGLGDARTSTAIDAITAVRRRLP